MPKPVRRRAPLFGIIEAHFESEVAVDSEQREEILHRFSIDILDPLTDEMKAAKDNFIDVSTKAFIRGTKEIIEGAISGFLGLVGVKSVNEVETELWSPACGYLVSAFNSVLPMDYPFVIALVITKDTGFSYITATKRSFVKGRHDLLKPNFIPFFETDDLTTFANGKLVFSRLITSEHGNNDGLGN